MGKKGKKWQRGWLMIVKMSLLYDGLMMADLKHNCEYESLSNLHVSMSGSYNA